MLVAWRRGCRYAREYSFLRQNCRGRSPDPVGLVVKVSTPPTREFNSPSTSPVAPVFWRPFVHEPWNVWPIDSDTAASRSRHRNIEVSFRTAVRLNSGSLKYCERPWLHHLEHDAPQSRRDPRRRGGSRRRGREARPNGSAVPPITEPCAKSAGLLTPTRRLHSVVSTSH